MRRLLLLLVLLVSCCVETGNVALVNNTGLNNESNNTINRTVISNETISNIPSTGMLTGQIYNQTPGINNSQFNQTANQTKKAECCVNVTIPYLDVRDEWVMIRSNGIAVNLSGWTLKDKASHEYKFKDFILKPNMTIRVHSGIGNDTAYDLYWGYKSSVWNDDGDTATLTNSSGNVVSQYTYSKPTTTTTTTTDSCSGVVCTQVTSTCPDSYVASCTPTCSSGACGSCNPDCTGHNDPCAGITCPESSATCLDGYVAVCNNSCISGVCSNCTPSCEGHCVESWNCSAWSECLNIQQNRTCYDVNNCGTLLNKPNETQECIEKQQLYLTIYIENTTIVRGNDVKINTIVTNGTNAVENVLVNITMVYASGYTDYNYSYTNSTGESLWIKTISGNANPGTFTINATAYNESYKTAFATTAFEVIAAS
ncbi:MAG: lamin tail domain-containing protein [Candidatus Aenigmatarchaeota archaeon]